jgi:hypothetical protein
MHQAETVDSAATASGSMSFNPPSYPLEDKLDISHSGHSLINEHEPRTYDTNATSEREGCRESIAQQAPGTVCPSSALACPEYTHPPAGLPHRSRALSVSSSLGSTHEPTGSSSLKDIQIRAASPTKSRRKTQIQTLSSEFVILAGSLCSRKSLSSLRTSDRMNENTRETIVKRRAIYTGSMYLDSSAISDATVRGFPELSSPPWSSVLSKTESTRQSLPSAHPQLSKVEDTPKRRVPLGSVDLNVQTKSKSPQASIPSSTLSVSRSSSFPSTDSFATSTVHRKRLSETAYHSTVLELLDGLDVAIGEWNAVYAEHLTA